MAEGGFNPLPVGTIVHQRYRITAVVGRGGLGTVYQVVDVLFGKSNVFALKELIDQSSGARKQFENESQWLHSLDHNNIPKVREHFDWQGRLYLVMDFVDGENLERKLARNGGRPLTEQDALRWILPICDALQYLHTRNPPILHRDVKPANIIVTPAGHPVLVDLGIAKEHLPGAGQTATFVRKAGTEGYAPPEQYAAAGQTGPWSDVYGVGATLYHLLTGRVPPTAVERVALDARLPSPRSFNPAISAPVDAAIVRALTLRPAERFHSLTDFARALTTPAAGAHPTGAPVSPPPPPSRPSVPPFPSAPSSPTPGGTPVRRMPRLPATRSLTSIPSPTPHSAPPTPVGMTMSQPGVQSSQVHPHTPNVRGSATALNSRPEMASHHSEALGVGGERGKDAKRRVFYRSPFVLVTGIVCAILIAVVISVLVLNATELPDRSSPQATVSGYFAALKAQDYQRAWQYNAQSRTDVSAESNFINGLKSDDAHYGRVINSHITSLENSGGPVIAQVDVSRSLAPGTIITYALNLTEFDNDTWLIAGISSTS
ncbi:MAG TPA: serine/threonine-protein kinase [Ktedonobacterales bacterium]|nr:serine/threonine-protein kinase [Ktedonobacterales bacterium]